MNFLSTFGKAVWVAAVEALGPSAPKYVAWGEGSGATADALGLVAESSESRVPGVVTLATTTTSRDTFRVVAKLVADSHKFITEVGTFQSMHGLDLCVYFDFGGISVKAGDQVTFTIDTQLV